MRTTTRQTVVFTKTQHEILKAEAGRLGVSVSDLIRRIVDGWRDDKGK